MALSTCNRACSLRRNPLARPVLPRHVAHRSCRNGRLACVVPKAGFSQGPKEAFDSLVKRYDFVSTMVGSLMVTGFCWSHGQDPITALSITFSSTVIAVVANELLFSGDKQ